MDVRDRSRSPRMVDLEEIISLVYNREQARQAKDWGLADELRDRLSAIGVTLFDKTSQWRSKDGQSGRIPTFSELEAGQTADVVIAKLQNFQTAHDPSDAEAHIKYLVQQREKARAAKNFAESDNLREELKALGVELLDKDKIWKSKSGLQGIIVGYRGTAGPSDIEITTLIQQRERARQSSDFELADMIRAELKDFGVEINDRDKVWRCTDGRSGPVPAWSDAPGVQPLPPVASAMPLRSSNQVHGLSLQEQLVQAALAAAANPAVGLRTLQLLQQVTGSAAPASSGPSKPLRPPPAPSVPASNGGLPKARISMTARSASAPSAPSAPRRAQSQEVFDALGFVSQCEATRRQPSDAEILWLMEVREKARQAKDFGSADELRDAMKSSLGIELVEKQKRWTTSDGRSGNIPLWASLS